MLFGILSQIKMPVEAHCTVDGCQTHSIIGLMYYNRWYYNCIAAIHLTGLESMQTAWLVYTGRVGYDYEWALPYTNWWKKEHVCEQLSRVVAWLCHGREPNPRPVDHEFDTL